MACFYCNRRNREWGGQHKAGKPVIAVSWSPLLEWVSIKFNTLFEILPQQLRGEGSLRTSTLTSTIIERDKEMRGPSQSADRVALPFREILIPRQPGVERKTWETLCRSRFLSFHESGNAGGSNF